MRWYLKVLRQYADFTGRARRTEYWMFVLVNVIASFVLTIVDYGLGLQVGSTPSGAGYGVLTTIYSLAVLVPSLAVAARRLHDTDRSGWWQLISVVPSVLILVVVPFGFGGSATAVAAGILVLVAIVAAIVLIVWLATDGRPGTNRFGPNPKDVAHV